MNTLFITTKHRAKMAGMISLNTSTECNPFCKKMQQHPEFVCSHCYAHQLERMYGKDLGYIKSYKENGEILSSRKLYKIEIEQIKTKFAAHRIARLHSFGELLNMIHLNNFIMIAQACPETTFALWSKRTNLIKKIKNKPKNLILIYSTPKLDNCSPYIPEGYDKVFTVYKKKTVEKNSIKINCNSRCVECLKCYSLKGPNIIKEQMK